ncbi:MAG: 5-oxoprolinase subunit PxpB [Flavobacteriaceae bacterium]|nr:5-oxoprolinase subunit PxpB [Flavobacteriaceae bacterium]
MNKKLPFRFFTTHPRVVILEWDRKPDNTLLNQLIDFQKHILRRFKEVTQITQGYVSLMLFHNTEVHHIADYSKKLYLIFESLPTKAVKKGRLWQIPVCYDNSFALDLKALALKLNLSPEALVELHTSASYQVYFIGFLPGFLYLGGLPKVLEHPRKIKPSPHVPQGSVGIGGKQTGIYPFDSPGGWYVIGKTPYPLFEPQKKKPCFAQTGDSIQFVPISKSEFMELDRQKKNGSLKLKPS